MGTGLVTTSKISKGVNMLKLARFFLSVGFVFLVAYLTITMPVLAGGFVLLGLGWHMICKALGR